RGEGGLVVVNQHHESHVARSFLKFRFRLHDGRASGISTDLQNRRLLIGGHGLPGRMDCSSVAPVDPGRMALRSSVICTKEMKSMKATSKSSAYWLTTGIVVFAMFSGGIAELAHRPETINGMTQLGYPVYFVMILGFWKLLGSLALVSPGFPRVKEWAYAGIFFNMTGAAVSHLVCHDAAWHVIVTLALAGLAVASWALRPASRSLGGSRQAYPRAQRVDLPSAAAA